MAKRDISVFTDSNNILEPRSLAYSFIRFPNLSEYAHTPKKAWYTDKYLGDHTKEAYNLLHSTHGLIGIKMLNVCRDGNEHHFDDVGPKIGLPKGNDFDIWKSLVDRGMIAFSSKHAYGKKYFKITPFGEEVLDIADANQAYFRIMRWYKIDEDQMLAKMMEADLAGDEAYKDQDPETFIALLEQIFDPSSKLRQIGSAYRWLNTIVNSLKKNRDFYHKMTCPEVREWLENARKWGSEEIEKFCRLLAKVHKSLARHEQTQQELADIEQRIVVRTKLLTVSHCIHGIVKKCESTVVKTWAGYNKVFVELDDHSRYYMADVVKRIKHNEWMFA